MSSKEGKATLRRKTIHIMQKCPDCNKEIRKRYMTRHRKSHTVDKPYECVTCHKKFGTKVNLKAHKKIHNRKFKFASLVCQDCKETLGTTLGLDDHLENLIKNFPFECSSCSFEYESKFRKCIANQDRIHSERDPYECLYCRKRFLTLQILEAHLEEHAGENPLVCENCKKVYSYTRPSFEEEEQYHETNKEKVYKCSTCPAYLTASGMNSHMLTVHDYHLRFSCRLCPRVCNTFRGFNKHTRKCENVTDKTKRQREKAKPNMTDAAGRSDEIGYGQGSNGDFDVRTYKLRRVACSHS